MKILYTYITVFLLLIPHLVFAQSGLEGGFVDNTSSDMISRLSIADQPISDIIEFGDDIIAYTNDSLFFYNVQQEEAQSLQAIGSDAVKFVGLKTNQTASYLFFNTYDAGNFETAMVYNLTDQTLEDLGPVILEDIYLVFDEIYFVGRESLLDNLGLYYQNSGGLMDGLTFGEDYQVEINSLGFLWIVFDKLLTDNVLYYIDTQNEPAKLNNFAQPNDLSFAMVNDNVYYSSGAKVIMVDNTLNKSELGDIEGVQFFKLSTKYAGFYQSVSNEMNIIDDNDGTVSPLVDFFDPGTFLSSNLQDILQLSDNYVALVNGNNEVMVLNTVVEFVNQGNLFSFNNTPFYGDIFNQAYLGLYSSESSIGTKSDEILYYDLSNNTVLVDIDFADYDEVGYEFRPLFGSARGKNFLAAYNNSNGFELNFLSAESTDGIKVAEEITNDQTAQDYLSDAGVQTVLEEYSTYPRRFIVQNETLYYLAHLASDTFEGLNFLYKVNEYPTSISLSSSSVSEGASTGAEVATFNTADVDDAVGSFTYSLVSGTGDEDNNLFTILGNKLLLDGMLDYETKKTLGILVQTIDPHGLSHTEAFSLSVTDANDPPDNINLSNLSVLENLDVGTKIADITTTDEDETDSFTYSLVDDAGNSFAISAAGELLTNVVFDYSVQNEFSITIQTEDQAGATFEKDFTISILEENTAPTDISLSSSAVAENGSSDQLVGELSATDPNVTTQAFSFSLVSGTGSDDNGSFMIDNSVSPPVLKASIVFDYEQKNLYAIRIEVSDQDGATYQEQIEINITDVNEAPEDINLSNLSVLENLDVGTKVADISTTDEDETESFTYTLVADASNSFAISATDELLTNVVFDYSVQNEFIITLETEDQAGATFQKDFTIRILQKNEAPTDISLSSSTVVENSSSDQLVGELSATDPNEANQSFTFSLVSGDGGDDNGSFVIDNAASPPLLKSSAVFDYEQKNSYNIRIEVADQDAATYQEQFVIDITNVNDVPDSLALNLPSLEFSSKEANEKISRILIRDQELQDGLSASYNLNDYRVVLSNISNNDGGNFNITAANSVYDLNAENALSFDANNSSNNIFTLELTVEDSNHPSGEITSYTQAFTIELKNDNNAFPPTEIQLSNNSLSENVQENPNGLTVGNLSTLDDNNNDSHTYSLVSDQSNGDLDNTLFEINEPDELAFKSFENISYDEDSVFHVNIRSTDETGLFIEQDFSIYIEEYIDENPPSVGTSLQNNEAMLLEGGQSLSFNASISDWELDTVTYKLGGILAGGNLEERGLSYEDGDSNIEIPISAGDFDAFGVKFQIFAKDKSGNSDSSNLFYLYHELGAENRYSALPDAMLGKGRRSADYKMFSVPYNLDNNEIRSFLEQQLGVVYSIYDFRILHWDSQDEEYIEIPTLTSFEEGQSYWFTTTLEDAEINFGEGKLYPYKADSAFVWQLKKGWNQIGNPYPVPLDWARLTEGTALEGSQLQTYDTAFQTSTILDPYQGAFVLANEAVNLKAIISSSSSERRTAEDLPFAWKVDLEIHQDGRRNKGTFGMHPQASVHLDKFDLANPPHFSENIEINFNKEERLYSNYKTDVVNSSTAHSWDFSINSLTQEKPASLEWSSEGILPKQLSLIDMNSLAKIDMAEQNQYYFTAEKKPEFRIVYGQYSTNINLGELRIGEPVPNPMKDRTLIGFNLPAANRAYKVSAEIISLDGKKVRQLTSNSAYESGYHQLQWNGLNEQATEVASGVYLYRIRIKGKDTKEFLGRILKTQ